LVCWVTVAELVYEIRTNGRHSSDALHLLTEEINGVTELRHVVGIAIGSSPPFSPELVQSHMDEIFCLLQSSPSYQLEQTRIISERLTNKRDV
jgi:hypothetical protein